MKVVSSGAVMVLGQSTNDYNGTVYYNVDLYDADSGLYSCGIDSDLFNQAIAALKNPCKDAGFPGQRFSTVRV